MIQLDHLRPRPMIDDGIDPSSQIWDKACQFEKGRRYLIVAPSGKGKSTLLHCIYGLRNDYEGQVQLEGQNIREISPESWSALRQKKLSIVFQDLRLFGSLTALENIQLKSNLSDHLSESQIREMATQLGIANLLGKTCDSLSYGQRQRVAIIRALAQPFDFLLLDEPFSHLDTENIRIASELILDRLKAQSAGLLLVSLGEDYGLVYDERRVL